jgi:hypothetical protein
MTLAKYQICPLTAHLEFRDIPQQNQPPRSEDSTEVLTAPQYLLMRSYPLASYSSPWKQTLEYIWPFYRNPSRVVEATVAVSL